MVDKKSDVFSKPTAASTADAAKKEASRSDAAEAAKPSFARPAPLDIKDDRDEVENPTAVKVGHIPDPTKAEVDAKEKKDKAKVETEFHTDKHKYTLTDPPGNIPSGQWGIAIWSRGREPEGWPAFLDNHGEWWWATTTNQNGVNPAVEKTEEPIGWRML